MSTTDPRPVSIRTPWTPRRRLVFLGLGLLLLFLTCWCGLFVRDALTFKSHWDDFQARLSSTSAGALDLKTLHADVTTLHADLRSLQSSGGPLLSLAPHLGWLPAIGPDAQAAPELLSAAIDFLDAGEIVLDALEPIWPPRAAEGESGLSAMLQGLVGVLPQLDAARTPLQDAVDRLARIDVERLSPALRAQLERIMPLLPMAESGFELLDAAPALFGFDRPKTYIVLLQNEDELRPTGGFISAVARVTLDRGAIVDLDVRDSYLVDDYLNKPYGEPPVALTEFMGAELWLFRDANWSPDFPTSARKAAELYTYGLDVPVDGVVGMNQQVVRNVVEALGAIEVAPGQTVTAANLISSIRQSWSPPEGVTNVNEWVAGRKDFAGVLANAILARLQNTPGDVNWIDLGRAILRSLSTRDLMIWLEQPDVAAILAEQNWDGALRSSGGDYLMVVDSNLGFNKVNTLIDSSATYQVTLNEDGSAKVDLLLRHQHTGLPFDGCEHLLEYTLELSYDTLVQTCYWDYVRVLTPSGARLLEATHYPAPANYFVTDQPWDGRVETTQELGKTVFGTLFVLERGASLQMGLQYELPASLVARENDRWSYRLLLQKQLGAPALPVRVVIHWPDTLVFVSAQPAPSQVDTHSLSLDLVLDTDRSVQVVLKSSP